MTLAEKEKGESRENAPMRRQLPEKNIHMQLRQNMSQKTKAGEGFLCQ